MNCNIKCVQLKKVLPNGTYPKREHNVRYFYHRTNGCYYMYDEKGCETNLTTCGNIIPLDRELIVGKESLDKNTLVHIGLEASYAHPNRSGIHDCQCHKSYISAWTYLDDIKEWLEDNGITREYYYVTLHGAPIEGGSPTCSGAQAIEDNNSNGFRFKFESNSRVNLHANTIEGYKFVGWKEPHTNEILSITENWNFDIKRDLTLYAVYEKINIKYHIECNANPVVGGWTNGNGDFDKHHKHTITAIPAEDYEFIKWTNAAGENISSQLQYDFEVTKNETYIAHFKEKEKVPVIPPKNKYNLEIEVNGLDTSMNEENQLVVTGAGTYEEGTKVDIKIDTKGNYEILDITCDKLTIIDKDLLTGTCSVIMDSHAKITITVNKLMTFELISNGNGKVSYGSSEFENRHIIKAPYNDNFLIHALADTGYIFKGWRGTDGIDFSSTDNPYNFIVGRNYDGGKIYASFEEEPPKEVTITIKDSNRDTQMCNVRYKIGNGEWSDWARELSFTITEGSEFTIDTEALLGYKFTNWFITSDNKPTTKQLTLTAPNKNATYSSQNTYDYKQVYVRNDGHGLVGIDSMEAIHDGTDKQVLKGTNVIVKTVPKENYEFDGWYADGVKVSSNQNYTFQVMDDITITAKFTEKAPEPYLNVYHNGEDATLKTIEIPATGGTVTLNVESNVSWTVE